MSETVMRNTASHEHTPRSFASLNTNHEPAGQPSRNVALSHRHLAQWKLSMSKCRQPRYIAHIFLDADYMFDFIS